MPLLNPPLTKDDFINSRWQDVVDNAERKDCLTYVNAFWQKAKEAGNTREQAVFEILATVSSAAIKPESNEEFFTEVFQNLQDEHLDFLADIAPEISDPELQARVTDILWARRRDHRMAQLAVPAYLESATQLEDPEQWSCCFDRIERAFRLAFKINYQPQVIVAHIEAVLDRYNGEDPLWLSEKLMSLLQERRVGSPPKYAALAEKAALLAESFHDWRRARAYWNIKAKWHLIEGNDEKERAASMLAAETHVKEAEDALKENPSYLRAATYLQYAVEAFRRIRGTREETIDAKARAEEVHKLLLQHQEEARKELIVSSYDIDITNVAEQAKAQVKGQDFQSAIFSLALLTAPTKTSFLRHQAQENARNFPLSNLFPGVIINDSGKVTARQPGSVLSNNPDEAEAATRFAMNQDAVYHQTFQAQALIEPARFQINLEHAIRIDDLRPITENSFFVPPGREYLFAKGLYSGLAGDFLTSTHILIPQIEHSIRYLLWNRGALPSGFDSRGIQNEHNLNTTLYRPEITSIFDEDTLFDLKNLLIEHSGSNLRNRMAHGLLNDSEFLSPLMSYLWWLTLRLCCLPILAYQQNLEQSDPWVKFAGMFKDDPLSDEFTEDMDAYRRELDKEAASHEITSEENQSA